MKKALAFVLCLCMSLSLFVGCGSSGAGTTPTPGSAIDSQVQKPDNTDPVYGGTLRYATNQTCATPGYTPKCSANSAIVFMSPAYETLAEFDESANIVPKLALRWETDPEEPSITWYLREGVQFSDGVAFNAEAVKRNIEEYQSCSRSETSNIVKCIVIDEFTVKMVLGHWDTSAIECIGTFIYFMSPEALDEYDVDTLSASTTSYGTGPFVISSFEPNVQITYERNENYWQEGLPYLDGVKIVYIGEASTLSAAFQSKDVDLIYSGNHDGSMDLMRVMAPQIESGDVVIETNTSGQLLVMNGLIPNSADPDSPWADARVRRALCYAIDREAIKVACYSGEQETTNQWAYPGSVAYDENLNGFTYNPEKAKELLAEAGYADGFTTTLSGLQSSANVLTACASMLEAVGITGEVNVIDTATFNSYMLNGNWDGLMIHSASVGSDLGLYMGRHLSLNGSFYTKGIDHPQEAMDLLNAISQAKTDEEKAKLQDEMQNLMYDADEGLALFGTPITMLKMRTFKHGYVMGENAMMRTPYSIDYATCWLNK